MDYLISYLVTPTLIVWLVVFVLIHLILAVSKRRERSTERTRVIAAAFITVVFGYFFGSLYNTPDPCDYFESDIILDWRHFWISAKIILFPLLALAIASFFMLEIYDSEKKSPWIAAGYTMGGMLMAACLIEGIAFHLEDNVLWIFVPMVFTIYFSSTALKLIRTIQWNRLRVVVFTALNAAAIPFWIKSCTLAHHHYTLGMDHVTIF